MDEGRIRINLMHVAAVEVKPWVAMAADARVLVHLQGGQTIMVFFEAWQEGTDRAQEAADFIVEMLPWARPV